MKLHNTMTGATEPLRPLEPGRIGMYVCGVTVYDYCHIGHARSALVFDVLRRHLESTGLTVEFVKNFTDVDDKIIKRANEQGVACEVITEKYIAAYREDMERLGIRPAWKEPRATEHMTDIIALVATLIDKDVAYQMNGDVYFSIEAYPAYGRLSKRRLEDLLVGARVEVDERKKHPMDFALWKSSKPGEPFWDSPWGPGRPGWHIECSAMSMRHLGVTFDIHGGGMDLIFPHHENEIAQSCAATGKEFAHTWVHNGFVQVNQEKMSKSLGNFFTIREIFEKCERYGWTGNVTAEVLRYFLLATHYRSPLDFSDAGLADAKRALDNLYDLFLRLEEQTGESGPGDHMAADAIERFQAEFHQGMEDDLNTPVVLAEFQRLRAELNKSIEAGLSKGKSAEAREAYRTFGRVLGLFDIATKDWRFAKTAASTSIDSIEPRRETLSVVTPDQIDQLLAERRAARQRKDFQRADEIRRSLLQQGITIEDRPDGTSRWKR
ncbi:MAG TPA: cysteine--tRNA ligase [Nitrospiraceae bacterium]|nr:cysteine--tRNA ligase [Nitrospiraceae bacterium]